MTDKKAKGKSKSPGPTTTTVPSRFRRGEISSGKNPGNYVAIDVNHLQHLLHQPGYIAGSPTWIKAQQILAMKPKYPDAAGFKYDPKQKAFVFLDDKGKQMKKYSPIKWEPPEQSA